MIITLLGRAEQVVTVVDESTARVAGSFLVFADAQLPRVTQKFVVEVPIASDDVTNKKIVIKNAYAMPRTFQLSTSRPDVVRLADDVVNLKPLEQFMLDVFFVKISHRPINVEVLLFISNAETNLQEEAYSLLVKYV
ncbi:unnamed protein product [Caenorhabditis auriculariae]|uniref:NPHP4 Ig-like domain-containing protein n=1 Tax=Caenorhabditis auriculariae TaxID=2777116 RepID=A0A8S1GVA7_9PELO|nr:unnamed protein product [Caenorhabditis auriculariae]